MKRHLFLLLTIGSLLSGCSKMDLDALGDQNIGTSIAKPIGTIDATIFDILQKFDSTVQFQYDENNTTFIYWEKSLNIDEFKLKDFSTGETLIRAYSLAEDPTLGALIGSLPAGATVKMPKGTYLIKDTLSYSFNFNETDPTHTYKIDSILIRHAIMDLGVTTSDLELDDNTYIEVELAFPNLASQKPITFKVIAVDEDVEVERHIGYFTANFGNSGTNETEARISFKIVSDGTKDITKNSGVGFSAEFKNIDYEILYGYIYNQAPVCSTHTTVEMTNSDQLYDFTEKNIVSLYNPEFNIELTTNLGTDARLTVKQLYATTRTGKRTDAIFHGQPTFTKILETSKHPYEYATTSITLNRNFGGMNELFKEIPDSLIIDWDLYLGSSVEKHNNFVVKPIDVDAKFSVRIPIWFDKGTAITFEDTLDADLTSINREWGDFVRMDRFDIYLDFTNTLPVHADAHISFLDSLGNVVYTEEGIEIDCPPVDEYGRSKDATEKEVVLQFPKEQIPSILKTKKIIVWYLISGYDEESTINFHATDGLRVKISAYATMALSTKNK